MEVVEEQEEGEGAWMKSVFGRRNQEVRVLDACVEVLMMYLRYLLVTESIEGRLQF